QLVEAPMVFGRGRDQTEAKVDEDMHGLVTQLTNEITFHMRECGLSRAELAARMGVSPGRISQILGGGENLTLRTLAALAADLDAVRGHFGLAKTALLGHSWGATLALRYALDHPDRVSALAYVSGTGLGWAWREPFDREMTARLEPHRARIDELRADGKDRE